MSRSALRTSTFLTIGLLASVAVGQEGLSDGLKANCDEISGNPREGETVCVGFKFNDGTSEISAGLAKTNALDSELILWRLSDGVRLSSGTTEILAAEALARLEAGELVLGELTGNPVIMSDYIAERETRVSGTSQGLSYNSRSGIVNLIGAATLTIGDNEVIGCDWIYNFNDKSYQAGTSDDCEGVTIVLAPPEENEDPEGQIETP